MWCENLKYWNSNPKVRNALVDKATELKSMVAAIEFMYDQPNPEVKMQRVDYLWLATLHDEVTGKQAEIENFKATGVWQSFIFVDSLRNDSRYLKCKTCDALHSEYDFCNRNQGGLEISLKKCMEKRND